MQRFEIGDVNEMTRVALATSEAGYNIHVEGRAIRRDLKGNQRGGIGDTTFVFALVIDNDNDRGKAASVQIPASLTVQTSPGNNHLWLLFDRPMTAKDAADLGARLLHFASGADACSGKVTGVYRLPGTPNFPTPSKVARGRVPVPTFILDVSEYRASPEALRAALPAPPAAPPRETLSTHDSYDRMAATSALKTIPNNDEGVEYEDWKNVMIALSNAAKNADPKTADEFRELADWWSSQCRRYNRANQHRAWRNFTRRDYNGNLGTIYNMAFERGWNWPRFELRCLGVWANLSVDEIAALLIEDRDLAAAKKERQS